MGVGLVQWKHVATTTGERLQAVLKAHLNGSGVLGGALLDPDGLATVFRALLPADAALHTVICRATSFVVLAPQPCAQARYDRKRAAVIVEALGFLHAADACVVRALWRGGYVRLKKPS